MFARGTFPSDNRAELASVTVPTLLVESAYDAIAGREVGAFVHAAIPGSRLVTLDATGHCPQLPLHAARGGRPRPRPAAVLTELNVALHRERLELANRFCSVVFGVLTPAGTAAASFWPPAGILRPC